MQTRVRLAALDLCALPLRESVTYGGYRITSGSSIGSLDRFIQTVLGRV